MPAAEARIDTERAGRYLAQLCQHVTSINATDPAISRHRQPDATGGTRAHDGRPPSAEWTETRGTISFPGGTITLQATADALIMRAHAGTALDLQRVQELVGRRLAAAGLTRDRIHLGASARVIIGWQLAHRPATTHRSRPAGSRPLFAPPKTDAARRDFAVAEARRGEGIGRRSR